MNLQDILNQAREKVENPVEPRKFPKTWDFSHKERKYGHDYRISRIDKENKRLDLFGWCEGIRIGDFLLLEHSKGIVRYKVLNVFYKNDNSFTMLAEFSPST